MSMTLQFLSKGFQMKKKSFYCILLMLSVSLLMTGCFGSGYSDDEYKADFTRIESGMALAAREMQLNANAGLNLCDDVEDVSGAHICIVNERQETLKLVFNGRITDLVFEFEVKGDNISCDVKPRKATSIIGRIDCERFLI